MDGHETFGQLVVSMRKQRRFLDNNALKPWTRAYLAEQSGLTLKQVTRVEQGSVVNMRPLLDPLAAAFGLSPAERVEFYGQAGYIHRGAPAPPDRGLLTSLLGELTYPVYVRTPLWDFVAYNAYHARLWGYDDPAKLDILRGGTVGPNLLRTIFDPVFEHRTAKGSEHAWHRDAERCLEGFRAMSFKYGHTDRYGQILGGLMRFADFRLHWDFADSNPPRALSAEAPMLQVHHRDFGVLRFVSTRIPQRYIGADLDVGMYVPTAESAEAYDRLRSSVRFNSVTYFPESPTDYV